MQISRRALIAVIAALIGAAPMAFAAGALGAPGHGHRGHPNNGHRGHPNHNGRHTGAPLIDESLAPSQPAPADPVIHGVSPGGLPWALRFGDVLLKRDGKLDLRVQGLVIPSMGTPGPVKTISASLYCGADSNTTPVDTTQQVALSARGDALIHDTSFAVPRTCVAPVILVHPNGVVTLYIAADGWSL